MLSHCHIKNLAIVKNLDLDLQSGMTVITGETGAGKSIIFDAIRLCFGERADAILIRPGFEKADIACTFEIHRLPEVIDWLKTHDFLTKDSSPECIIRRVLYLGGRSKAYINGSPATHLQLKALGEYLIQIHGQHQYQALLKPTEQLRLLDAFADHLPKLTQVQKAYQKWKAYALEKQTLLNTLNDSNRIALLRYQAAELKELHLQTQELEQLDRQQNQLYHAQTDSEEAHLALNLLSEDIFNLLQKTIDLLKKLTTRHAVLQTAYDLVLAAHIQLQEALTDLNTFYKKIEINPKQLHYVEQRLSAIYDVARKHKVRPENLLAHFESLKTELEHLNHIDERLLKLDQALIESEKTYRTLAQELSLSRLKASQILSKEIEQRLEPLGMPGGRFEITLHPHEEASLHGLESTQFCVSVNPGHPVQPLHKVASGGELSRISLAIQLIVAQYLKTPTLIFDEVDTGVSGKMGATIGQALKELGQSVQVLCITHLPQVAALGKQHLHVIKHQNTTETHTTIESLIPLDRIEELARMLGGMHITQEAREHAKGLLNLI